MAALPVREEKEYEMKKQFMFATADNPVLRIMPLGDSITHGSQSVRGNGYCAVSVMSARVVRKEKK